ncbi:MAG: hypothetical protein IKF82_00990 [Bacilli bacterium]|nr:hypothetical protein [Bacilli bacterium]
MKNEELLFWIIVIAMSGLLGYALGLAVGEYKEYKIYKRLKKRKDKSE